MTCPPIEDLLAGNATDHAGGCDDCRAVLDLVDIRSVAGCGRAEALMAARAAGRITPDSARLLARHLDSCASCALVAGSLDAPEVAGTLASAAELDRGLDGPLAPGVAAAPPRRHRYRIALAAIALAALAAAAAAVTRALG